MIGQKNSKKEEEEEHLLSVEQMFLDNNEQFEKKS